MSKKNLLILCAQSDPCDEELKLIEAVGNLLGMNICKTKLKKEDDLKKTLCGKNNELWDYVYLATHADIYGFGDADPNGLDLKWTRFARVICEADCLAAGAMLFLGCCRGGLKGVADRMFDNCNQIDYICGPRWTLKADDIAAAFHVFIYNLEVRNEQPSTAVSRASQAVGYEFFCYDRAEREDSCYIEVDEGTDAESGPTESDSQDGNDKNGAGDGKPVPNDSCTVLATVAELKPEPAKTEAVPKPPPQVPGEPFNPVVSDARLIDITKGNGQDLTKAKDEKAEK